MRKNVAITTSEEIETEQALLGSFLQDKKALDILETEINRDDFSRIEHQIIYDSILKAYKVSDKVDIITAREALGDQLKDVGGAEYLFSLVESVPTPYNAPVYAKMVIANSRVRKSNAAIIKAHSLLSEGKTPEEVNEYLLNELSGISIANKSSIKCAKELANEHYEFLRERANLDTDKLFSSGFSSLDEKFMLFGDSNVVVIKAERGSGKTHTGIHLSMQCAKHSSKEAIFYSLEMNRFQLENRFLAYIADKDSQILQHPGDDDWTWIANAQAIFSDTNIHISDDADVSIETMYRECKQFVAQGHEIGLIIIDFAEQIAPSKARRDQNREQELSANSRGLRKIANDFRCTVVLLSQVNDEGKERGSRGIGNLADLLMTWKCDSKSETGTLASDKNRFGPSFFIGIHIDKSTSRMYEIDSRYEPSNARWSDNYDRSDEQND